MRKRKKSVTVEELKTISKVVRRGFIVGRYIVSSLVVQVFLLTFIQPWH